MATLIVAGLLLPTTLSPEPATPEIIEPIPVSVIPDVPVILARIADCESGHGVVGGARQFNADGSVVRGKINPQDIGKYQINEYWNGETARSLGFDIYTLEGNTRMALYLYKTRGLQPWEWSRACWGKYL